MKKLKKSLFACGFFVAIFALTIFAACRQDTPGKDDDVVIEPGKDYGVEYTLTATGYSLRPILDSMVAWGTDYQKQNGGAPCDP